MQRQPIINIRYAVFCCCFLIEPSGHQNHNPLFYVFKNIAHCKPRIFGSRGYIVKKILIDLCYPSHNLDICCDRTKIKLYSNKSQRRKAYDKNRLCPTIFHWVWKYFTVINPFGYQQHEITLSKKKKSGKIW